MADAPSNLTVVSTGSAFSLEWINNESYPDLDMYRKPYGGSYAKIEDLGATDTSYSDTSASANITYYWKVYAASFGFSNEVTCARWSDTKTINVTIGLYVSTHYTGPTTSDYEDTVIVNIGLETIALDGGDFVDEILNDISITTLIAESQTLITDYKYYLGTGAGLVNEYSGEYTADNGVSIDSYWRSKAVASFDIAPSLYSNWLTLYKVQVTYVDLSANLPIIVSISLDGGTTWEPSPTKEVGNGDGTIKDAYFYFVKNGATFDFKIEMPSTDKKFQIIRMLGFFSPGGEIFQVN